LHSPLEQLGDFGSPRSAELAKIGAIEQFHDKKWMAVVLVNFKNGADVGMVEGGSSLGFPLEAAAGRRMASIIGADEFDSDFAEELLILGNIDIAHAAGTEMAQDLVM